MKFLADEQFPHGCVQRLRALDHDVVEVAANPQLVGLDEVEDLLPWAKRHQRVLLSGDHIQDRDTRARLNEHLRRTRRGRVIIVKKASTQSPLKSLAKLLWHLEDIEAYFAAGHGEVRIGDFHAIKYFRPVELPHVIRVPTEQGYEYVMRRRQKKLAPINRNLARRPRPKPQPATASLDIAVPNPVATES